MDNLWMLLIVAGLVVGVVLVSGTLMNTQTVSPRESEEPTADSAPEESQGTYDQESKSGLSGEVTTLDFKVDVTRNGESYTHRFRVRHPDTKDEDIRIDSTRDDGAEMTIILKGSTDEGWVNNYSSSEWTYFTGVAFTQMWQNRRDRYLAYRVNDWREMEGEEFTVKGEDGTARVYDIRVNRDIPSSVFTR